MHETLTEFHKYLSDYYVRDDYKLTFRNGMSLSELSLAMWEILGFKDMDPSFLSRVINGKRLFSEKHLDAFFKVLKISKSEQNKLRDALHKDRMKMLGVKDSTFSAKADLDFANQMIDTIWHVEKQDNISLAIKLSDVLNHWMEDKVYNSRYDDEFVDLYAMALISAQFNNGTVVDPSETIEISKKHFDKLMPVVGKNENTIGMGYFFIGDAQYVGKNYENSIHWNKKAISLIKDAEFRLRTLRDLALNYAYLGLKDEFLTTRSKIYIELDKLKKVKTVDFYAFICHVYEAIARSEGLLGMDIALKTIKKADDIVNDNLASRKVSLGLTKVLVLRSNLEIVANLYPNDKINIERLAQEGIAEARKNNYMRYAKIMENLLKKIHT